MRLSVLRKVDLPQPEGPMRAVTWRAGMSMSTSWSAWWLPYQRLRPRISNAFWFIYFSLRLSLVAERLAATLSSSVSSMRMVATEKATLSSPRSVA